MAVSKLKPANDILALVQQQEGTTTNPAPHLHFGENYAQELAQKAALLPRAIRWHFIGGLQSTHCKTLARIPNLFAVSSIDSAKKAQLLDKARGDFLASSSASSASSAPGESSSSSGNGSSTADADNNTDSGNDRGPIGVHVQVNTSGEPTKSGVAPGADVVALCRLVLTACPHLRLLGLMTIGAIARSVATTPETENDDFRLLAAQRDLVAAELAPLLLTEAGGEGGRARELELSMGMSEDFEGAIAMGSSEVRVGSTIFGARGPKSEAKVVE